MRGAIHHAHSSVRRCSPATVRRIARGITDHSWTLMNTDGARVFGGFVAMSVDEWFFRGVVTI